MNALQVIEARKSTRAFRSDPVPLDLIKQLIRSGVAAPSKGNCQIWEFVTVAGEKKKAMDKMLLKLLKTDFIPSMQIGDPNDSPKNEALKRAEARSRRNKTELSEILSPLDLLFDTFMLEGTFSFFNAPIAILVFIDQVFAKDLPHILSVGATVQNILLAATELGLGTCWIGGVWRYTKEINELIDVPVEKKLYSSIALGYPDLDSPISQYKSARDDSNEFVRWIGFEESKV
jgi:nitroreductase